MDHNLSARYESETTLTTTINEVPITLTYDAPLKVEQGKEISYSVNYFSGIDYPLENLTVRLEPISGFTVKSSDPVSLDKNAFDDDLKALTKIKQPKTNPSSYDLVVIGTPIWNGIVPSVKAYLEMFKGKFKRVAFFSTFGASAESAFYHMEKACGKASIATLELQDRQINSGNDGGRLKEFFGKIKY